MFHMFNIFLFSNNFLHIRQFAILHFYSIKVIHTFLHIEIGITFTSAPESSLNFINSSFILANLNQFLIFNVSIFFLHIYLFTYNQ